MTKGGKTFAYSYGADGVRTQKTVDGVTTEYYTVGGKLLAEKTGDRVLTFYYDDQGAPVSVELNGTRYYYCLNLQGDVVGLYSSTGAQVVSYTYDPWGKLLNITDTSGTDIGAINPLRYRGYYYDTETGFYFLQSRYYDPTVGRFINADGYVSTGQGISGYNMFAYCGNDPVNRADDNGEFWHIVGGAVIGATISIVMKIVTNVASGESITSGLLTAGLAGAISGGLAASGIGLVGQVVGNALISAGSNAVDQSVAIANGTQTDGFDVGSLLLDGAIGAAAGLAGGAGAGDKGLTKIGVKNIKRSMNALTHKGARAAASTLGKGLSYFGKNARHIYGPLARAFTKSTIAAGCGTVLKMMIY